MPTWPPWEYHGTALYWLYLIICLIILNQMSQGCKPAAISPFQSFADLCSTYIYIHNTYIQYIYTIHIYNTYILYNYIIIYIYIIHAYDIRLHYLSLCLLLLLLLLSSCIMYHHHHHHHHNHFSSFFICACMYAYWCACVSGGAVPFLPNIYPHPVLQVPRNRIKP